MIVIFDIDKEHYDLLEKRHWCVYVFEKDYENLKNCSRYILIRYEGEIIGYCYIDYRNNDEIIPSIFYMCICELRKYEEHVNYFIDENDYGEYTNDSLILVPSDEERIHEEIENFLNREDKTIWNAPKYLRNKERTIFKVLDEDSSGFVVAAPYETTEFLSLLRIAGLIEDCDVIDEDTAYYKLKIPF